MANENQTIFQILVDVLGQDAVDKLTESVGGAGEAGTKAAPELQAFVDQLQDLADKSKLVSDAINLQERLRQNSESLNEAKKSLAARCAGRPSSSWPLGCSIADARFQGRIQPTRRAAVRQGGQTGGV